MAIQLTPEPNFEGSQSELETVLLQGTASRELTDDEFWESIDRETNAMLDSHRRNAVKGV